jgi:hypothetical protein
MEDATRLIPPRRGVASATTFSDQPVEFAPYGSMENVRIFTGAGGGGDRPMPGQRPPLARVYETPLGDGEVQGQCSASRPSTATYQLGTPQSIVDGGVSLNAPAASGNIFVLDTVPSMLDAREMDVTAWGGSGTAAANAVAYSVDGGLFAVASNFTDGGGNPAAAVQVRNTADSEVVWSALLDVDNRVNSLCFTNSCLVVCTSRLSPATGSARMHVFNKATGARVQATDIDGWSSEIIRARRYVIDGVERIRVAFNGGTAAGLFYDGPFFPGEAIESGNPARHFRTGIAQYRVAGTVFTREQCGPAPSLTGDPAPEQLPDGTVIQHGTFRVSQRTERPPFGCLITSLAVAQDGTSLATRTNQGYGPQAATYPPDGAVYANLGIFAVSAAGEMLWERDCQTIVEVGLGGYYNDIPTSGSDFASLLCAEVDNRGYAFVGGRTNDGGFSAFMVRMNDGSIVWRADLQGGSGRVLGVAVDPTDGNPVFCGQRNTSWTGSGGTTNAHLWKRSRIDGSHVWSFDLGSAVAANDVAIAPWGGIAYVTENVP